MSASAAQFLRHFVLAECFRSLLLNASFLSGFPKPRFRGEIPMLPLKEFGRSLLGMYLSRFGKLSGGFRRVPVAGTVGDAIRAFFCSYFTGNLTIGWSGSKVTGAVARMSNPKPGQKSQCPSNARPNVSSCVSCFPPFEPFWWSKSSCCLSTCSGSSFIRPYRQVCTFCGGSDLALEGGSLKDKFRDVPSAVVGRILGFCLFWFCSCFARGLQKGKLFAIFGRVWDSKRERTLFRE